MNERYQRLRGMFANHGVCEVQDATEKLVERFSTVGARIYLEAQLEYLSDLESRVVSDDPFCNVGGEKL